MPTYTLKWKNLSVAIRIKLSAGAVYLIAMGAAFLYILASKWIPAAAENFLAGLGAIWAISATMMAQVHGANKLDVEAAKANAEKALNTIKTAAAGLGAAPPEDCGK
jgi:hypothetical protein